MWTDERVDPCPPARCSLWPLGLCPDCQELEDHARDLAGDVWEDRARGIW